MSSGYEENEPIRKPRKPRRCRKYIQVVKYKDFVIEFDPYDVAGVFLISVTSPFNTTPLKFLIEQDSIQDWGMEKFSKKLIDGIIKTEKEIKKDMRKQFLLKDKEFPKEMIDAFKEAKRRGLI